MLIQREDKWRLDKLALGLGPLFQLQLSTCICYILAWSAFRERESRRKGTAKGREERGENSVAKTHLISLA